jgi:hypothetical protein
MGHYKFVLVLCLGLLTESTGWSQSAALEYTVPIKLYNDYLVVAQGSIGELSNRNLVIDTGAYPSVVDRSVAKKLRFSGTASEMRVVDHTLTAESAVLPDLRIGPMEVQNVRVVVRDLDDLSRQFGTRIDALVGLDILAHSSFLIDYKSRTLTFGAVTTLSGSAPIRELAGLACVEVRTTGHDQLMLLDTGAAGLLLFSDRAPWVPRGGLRMVESSNIGGTFRLRQLKLDELLLGNQNLGAREILISDAKNMSVYPFDGLLAPAALHFRQIAFDFERHVFSWETEGPHRDVPRVETAAFQPGTRTSAGIGDRSSLK